MLVLADSIDIASTVLVFAAASLVVLVTFTCIKKFRWKRNSIIESDTVAVIDGRDTDKEVGRGQTAVFQQPWVTTIQVQPVHLSVDTSCPTPPPYLSPVKKTHTHQSHSGRAHFIRPTSTSSVERLETRIRRNSLHPTNSHKQSYNFHHSETGVVSDNGHQCLHELHREHPTDIVVRDEAKLRVLDASTLLPPEASTNSSIMSYYSSSLDDPAPRWTAYCPKGGVAWAPKPYSPGSKYNKDNSFNVQHSIAAMFGSVSSLMAPSKKMRSNKVCTDSGLPQCECRSIDSLQSLNYSCGPCSSGSYCCSPQTQSNRTEGGRTTRKGHTEVVYMYQQPSCESCAKCQKRKKYRLRLCVDTTA